MNNSPYDSVLQTTKKMLGVSPAITDFNPDIITAINAAFFSLKQLGIETKNGKLVYDSDTTYTELFGDDFPGVDIEAIKQYVYCKTRILFDPPQSNVLLENLKEQASELEWRLRLSVELREEEIDETRDRITEIPNDTIKEIWDDVMELKTEGGIK